MGRNSVRGERFVPRVEGLEDRTVPSGNVRVTVLDGTLYVSGDDQNNQVMISATGKQSAIVKALDATTTINGQSFVSVKGIRRDYYIDMFGGNDVLVLNATRNKGSLRVDMGSGDDTLLVNDAQHRKETTIFGGSGDDNVILGNSTFRRYVFADTGAGDDQVTAFGIGVGDFGLQNPSGKDFFNNVNSTLLRPVFVGFTNGVRPATPAAPTPTLATSVGSAAHAAPIPFTVTFDKDVTGFDAGDLVVTNGSVSSFTQQDARTYAFQVAPAGQGVVTAQVAAGAATDTGGNASLASNTVSVSFDSAAPTLTINPPRPTTDTTPTITGTVSDPTATVQVTVNSKTMTATVSGNTWSATVATALANGTYEVTATATDAAGNSNSATSTLVVDTAAPAKPTLNLLAADDSGPVGDLRTDKNQVTLTGAAEAGSTVKLFRVTAPGTPGSGTPVATTTASSTGSYSFANIALAVGPNSFAVQSVDAAGNASTTFAQTFTRNTPPTVANPVGPQTASAGGSDLTFDLSNVFADAETVVRFSTAFPTGQTGHIDINLFPGKAPQTVTNFLSYVNGATTNYDGSIFHRLVPGFVLQGGGFKFNDAGTTTATAFPPVATNPPTVHNEPGVSNTLGTISMAKGSDPNSATDEFFFNLADNSTALDNQNGGFTVFGQVMNGGQQAINNIVSSVTTYSGSGIPGASPFPVRSGANTTNFPANINSGDLAFITAADLLTAAQRMTFAVTNNTNPAAATASASGATLTIHPLAAGTTTITVRATDLDGSSTTTQITVVVS